MQRSEKLPKYRWIILSATWMACLMNFLSRLSIGPLAPFLKDSLNISNTQVGLLVTAAGISYIPTLIVSGWLVDRFGVRRVLTAGIFIGGLGILSIYFASSYQAIFIIMALTGIGFGCIMPSAIKAVVLWFPRKERATALGLNASAVNVAGIIGASLLPTVAIALGWRYGFLFIGACVIVISLYCGLVYRDPHHEDLPVQRDIPEDSSPKISTTRLAIELFKSRDIWVLSLGGFFVCMVEFAALTNLVVYFNEELLIGVVAAGGLLAITEAAGAFGKPLSGLVSDRLLGGRRKTVFLLMAGTAGIVCLVFGISGNNLGWLLYPILLIFGMAAIGWGGLYVAMASELAGREVAGKALGIAGAILVLGSMAGPPFFGYIVDSTGSFQTAWLVMALCGAISVTFLSLVREYKKRL
ncbi:MFS transporter [Chloroflexota bacterium]